MYRIILPRFSNAIMSKSVKIHDDVKIQNIEIMMKILFIWVAVGAVELFCCGRCGIILLSLLKIWKLVIPVYGILVILSEKSFLVIGWRRR